MYLPWNTRNEVLPRHKTLQPQLPQIVDIRGVLHMCMRKLHIHRSITAFGTGLKNYITLLGMMLIVTIA